MYEIITTYIPEGEFPFAEAFSSDRIVYDDIQQIKTKYKEEKSF